MNLGGFSWRRLFGISAFKSRISRAIGIPLTKGGRRRKLGASVFNALGTVAGTLALAAVAAEQHRKSNQPAVSPGTFVGYGLHCCGCDAMALYPTHEVAMARTLTGVHFSEYDKLIAQGRIRFVGWGKFEHKCTDFPVGSGAR
jgi:hypothetical protein